MTDEFLPDTDFRTLLVEDDAFFASILARQLCSDTMPTSELDRASTLAEALACLRDNAYTIILLDPDLPDSTGGGHRSRRPASCPAHAVIVVTDSANPQLAMDVLLVGAQDCLVREDTNRERLVRSIQYAIQRKQAENDLVRGQGEIESLRFQQEAILRSLPVGLCSLDAAWVVTAGQPHARPDRRAGAGAGITPRRAPVEVAFREPARGLGSHRARCRSGHPRVRQLQPRIRTAPLGRGHRCGVP